MRNIIIVVLAIIVASCSKTESLERDAAVQPELLTVDPFIEKYSEMGSIEKAPTTYMGSFDQCSPSLGIYLFIPDYGPFAGEVCEILRFAELSDISGPCGDEFHLDYQETTLQGFKYVDGPVDGYNCYTFQGPNSCVLVHCDENEVE